MLPRKRSAYLVCTLLIALARRTDQHGDGAPPGACINQMPSHEGISPQTSTPPYVIVTSSSQVRQGDRLQVTVTSPAGTSLPIGGFILQARQVQNPDTIIGTFTKVPNTEMEKIISCRGTNDSVTHTTPEDKRGLTFDWKAPDDFLGGIEFRATVAQSYSTFWKNVESPVVEVVTPDTVITSTVPPPISTRVTQPPPVIMESKQKAPQQMDAIYTGCGDNKLCFGSPEGCIQSGNCKAIVGVFVAGDIYTFELQGTDNPKYVAAGLSQDSKMGDDSAMECVQNNGRIALYTSWTYPKTEPYVNRKDSPQDIVTLQESSFVNGKIYCKFVRDTVSNVKGNNFDLAKNTYNLMVIAGSSMKDSDRVGFHDAVYSVSAPLQLSSVEAAQSARTLLRLHGAFMIAAWIGAASIGILLARYYRQTWVGKTVGGKDIWFAYHRIVMVTTWLLTIAGFIIIMVDVGGWGGTGDNPHAITGIITVVLCFIQPIGAYFRPHPGTKRRPIFNWAHWLIGNSAHILGIITIFFAVYLQKAGLPDWSVYVLAAFVAFHVVMHLVLSLTVCVGDGRISNGRVNSFPMKDMHGHTRQTTHVDTSGDAPYSGFRKLSLGIYATVIILFAIVLIILVALGPSALPSIMNDS